MRSPSYHGVLSAALTVLLVTAPLAAAQQRSDQPPPPQASAQLTHTQARADVRTFLHLLEATHPDPYTGLGGKIAFERRAQAMIDSLPANGLSVGALAERLGTFVAPLHDGHTNVTLYNSMWKSSKEPLPIRFQITADTFFVTASDLPGLRGTRGDKVLGVNGHSIAELQQSLSARFGTENIYGLDRILANVLHSEDLLQLLIPELTHGQSVTYSLASPAGEPVDRTVPFGGRHGTDPDKWLEKPVVWGGLDRSNDLFYYRMLDSGRTAYFRVAAMGGREAVQAYRHINLGGPALLHEILVEYYQLLGVPLPADVGKAIEGLPSVLEIGTQMMNAMKRTATPNLIIDIRGNGGGMTGVLSPLLYQLYGDDYFKQQFSDHSVTVMSPLYVKFFSVDTVKEQARNPNFEVGWYQFNNSDNPMDSIRGTPGSAQWARARREASLRQWKDRGYSTLEVNGLEALDGKALYRPQHVVVLVDPGTFSAGFQIEFFLHELGATLIGVPSGQSPNAFMQVTPFTLPASHLSGSIANSTQVFMPNTPDARVLPMDFDATYSVFRTFDFDQDSSLRFALALLREGKI